MISLRIRGSGRSYSRDGRRAGSQQAACSGVQGRASRHDVVDQQHVSTPAASPAADPESTLQVAGTFGPTESTLGRGGSTPTQGVLERQSQPLGQRPGDRRRLVVPAAQVAAPVQRHGNDQLAGREPILEQSDQVARQLPAEIFEASKLQPGQDRVDRRLVAPSAQDPRPRRALSSARAAAVPRGQMSRFERASTGRTARARPSGQASVAFVTKPQSLGRRLNPPIAGQAHRGHHHIQEALQKLPCDVFRGSSVQDNVLRSRIGLRSAVLLSGAAILLPNSAKLSNPSASVEARSDSHLKISRPRRLRRRSSCGSIVTSSR